MFPDILNEVLVQKICIQSIRRSIFLLDCIRRHLAKLINLDYVANLNPFHLVGSEVVTAIFVILQQYKFSIT
jgi:hypothetical protein